MSAKQLNQILPWEPVLSSFSLQLLHFTVSSNRAKNKTEIFPVFMYLCMVKLLRLHAMTTLCNLMVVSFQIPYQCQEHAEMLLHLQLKSVKFPLYMILNSLLTELWTKMGHYAWMWCGGKIPFIVESCVKSLLLISGIHRGIHCKMHLHLTLLTMTLHQQTFTGLNSLPY